jgi:hypothetical protein
VEYLRLLLLAVSYELSAFSCERLWLAVMVVKANAATPPFASTLRLAQGDTSAATLRQAQGDTIRTGDNQRGDPSMLRLRSAQA